MNDTLANIAVVTIDGETTKVAQYLGKATLIVNVASKCGFTPQYSGLQGLFQEFRGRGLSVLGFPCDQFGHQEPGNEAQIKQFCSFTYEVGFPLFAKIEVNGPNAHPLYRRLKAEAPGFLGFRRINWNFTKFLLSGDSEVVRRFAPTTTPENLHRDISRLLD